MASEERKAAIEALYRKNSLRLYEYFNDDEINIFKDNWLLAKGDCDIPDSWSLRDFSPNDAFDSLLKLKDVPEADRAKMHWLNDRLPRSWDESPAEFWKRARA